APPVVSSLFVPPQFVDSHNLTHYYLITYFLIKPEQRNQKNNESNIT
ncbi:hypothetical protein HJC23_008655, partial [Cyclotella cryptica]